VSACVYSVEKDTKFEEDKNVRLCESDVKICDHFERLHKL
jgi:hypothetical protein